MRATKEYRLAQTQRAKAIVDQLALEEKVSLMSGRINMQVIDPEAMQKMAGSMKSEENHYNITPYAAGGLPAHGVPPMLFCDGPRGVVCGNWKSTCFPVSMARGASFDPALEEEIGHAIGREVCAYGGNLFAGVCINLPYNPGGVYQEADPSLPLLVGSSEEEMAAFADPTPGGLSRDQLREKLLAHTRAAEAEAGEAETPDDGKKRWAPKGKRPSMGGTDRITEDNVDAIIAAFRAIDRKGVDPEHIYYQIVSMGGGAFLQALAKAEKGCAPVYAYFFTFDAPHPRHPSLRFAWHTADLPLQMRVVAHADCEQISREMAHAWAAYIRTGSPSTEELPWPAFTATGRETMVLDTPCRVENDPTRPYRETLA